MKKSVLSIALVALSFFNYSVQASTLKPVSQKEVNVTIDLNKVKDDKVMVTIIPPSFSSKEVVFHLPKTVPGTYSEDNYGKYIDNLKAFDKKGKELVTSKTDYNSWTLPNAKSIAKITYWVNDTYDTEKGRGYGMNKGKEDIFSPAGTNILEAKNFMLNNYAFVGFFEDKTALTEMPYHLTILHPAGLYGATSLIDEDKSDFVDVFHVDRYFELTDNPIMYSRPDFEKFTVDGMEVLFSVYSPSGVHTSKALLPYLEKTMRAQKAFMGSINTNKRYTVLLYLSNIKEKDAMGFGALEHHTSTTVVFPEMMSEEALGEQIKDVVSHEFFHTITPLSIHSKEIQYFDYSNPKMSEHLWMYEGVTEYFANLFQINQGLIDPEEFYGRMATKIENASTLNDTMSFTKMSKNVLVEPYKSQYLNVYEKGALIGMCIDIIIREKSNGERGILDLMKKLSKEYGVDKPFNDDELFSKVTQLTYPEVGEFLKTYVAGGKPIPYDEYFAKMGVTKSKVTQTENAFLKDVSTPYITVNGVTKEIMIIPGIDLSDTLINLGLKGGDVIKEVNGKAYNVDNLLDLLTMAQLWKNDELINLKIKRDGADKLLSGKLKLTTTEVSGYELTDTSKQKLNDAWLKG